MTTDSASPAFKCDSNTMSGARDSVPAFAIASKDPVKKMQLIEALDHSAYTLGLQGKFDLAHKDAQKIIAYDPTLVTGYRRVGELYEAQGKQLCAIETFDAGLLQCISAISSCTELVEAKNRATEQNNRRVDFIAELPFELIRKIIIDLPKMSIAACLEVSSVWRSKLFGCKSIWATMQTDDAIDNKFIAAVLPHVAVQVEDLTMSTRDPQIWSRYMDHLENGSFTKIKSLSLEGSSVPYIPSALVISHVRSTLRKLKLSHTHFPIGVNLSDILFACGNLTHLVYCGEGSFSDVIGNPTVFGEYQHPLRDLELDCPVTGTTIEPFLRQHRNIERLILERGADSALDVVYSTCRNLRIFASNPRFKVTALEDLDVTDSRPGLRELHAIALPEYKRLTPRAVLQLIEKSMETLRVIKISTPFSMWQFPLDSTYVDPSDQVYDTLRLPNLQQISYWADCSPFVEPIVLRSISACTSLRSFAVKEIENLDPIISALMTLPPVEDLRLSLSWGGTATESNLVRLFRCYATYSRTHSVCLSNCFSAKNDALATLGDIQSLRNVTLKNLENVSENGLNEFLLKISGNVRCLTLSRMDITDNHLTVIGTMRHLTQVKFEDLDGITSAGIIKMMSSFQTLEYSRYLGMGHRPITHR